MSDSKNLSIKLLVDKETNKVVFAESGKDFVELLFSFFTVSIGNIIKSFNKQINLGCMDALHLSAESLDTKYFRSDACKKKLLCNWECSTRSHYYFWAMYTNLVCSCNQRTDEILFVNGSEKFIIMDDLRIKNISGETGLSIIRQLGIKDVSNFEERVASVGTAELRDFLNLSLHCTTPMTNLFQLKQKEINTKKIKPEPLDVKSQPFNQIMLDAIAKVSLKLVVSISQKKVLYALGNEEFVDLIFSPLAFSIETMAELFGGYSSIGSMDNLIKSEESLCNEDPENFKRSERVPFDPKFGGGIIKGPAYFMVTDELVVEPFSLISSISYVNKMGVPLSDLGERSVNFGEHEVLSILKASLTSKTALTDVFWKKK